MVPKNNVVHTLWRGYVHVWRLVTRDDVATTADRARRWNKPPPDPNRPNHDNKTLYMTWEVLLPATADRVMAAQLFSSVGENSSPLS
jgi:hypothetical protein